VYTALGRHDDACASSDALLKHLQAHVDDDGATATLNARSKCYAFAKATFNRGVRLYSSCNNDNNDKDDADANVAKALQLCEVAIRVLSMDSENKNFRRSQARNYKLQILCLMHAKRFSEGLVVVDAALHQLSASSAASASAASAAASASAGCLPPPLAAKSGAANDTSETDGGGGGGGGFGGGVAFEGAAELLYQKTQLLVQVSAISLCNRSHTQTHTHITYIYTCCF
jgi:hypothetical protein